jgi:hypothetical protein
MTPEEVE